MERLQRPNLIIGVVVYAISDESANIFGGMEMVGLFSARWRDYRRFYLDVKRLQIKVFVLGCL